VDTPLEPRWLDEDERRAWLALSSVLLRLPAALDAQLQRDAGMSHFEYGVLAALSESPGQAIRMSELAALAEGSLPRLSQVVTRMEKRGWVRRAPDPADGRYTLAILTGEGWSKITATAPGHVETVRHLVFDQLTRAQARQLHGISRRIMRAIDPEDRCLDDPSPAPAAGSHPALPDSIGDAFGVLPKPERSLAAVSADTCQAVGF
jgi:DNA-binding MarR family transcriptional regulator